MANIWAIKNGDWSDATIWNTGVLPTSSDDVFANNYSININQNVSVISLRNTASTGINAGGSFIFNTGGITLNISNNIFYTATIFNVTATSGLVTINLTNAIVLVNTSVELIKHTGNCNLTISLISLGSGNDPYINKNVLTKTSNGNLTITGNIIGTSGANYNKYVIYNSGGGNINIVGNVTAGSTVQNAPAILIEGIANLTVNGSVTGASGSLGGYATITFSSSGVCNIIGNVSGNVSAAIYANNGTTNINGAIIGGNSAGVVGVIVNSAAILNHVGSAQASSFASAIKCDTPTASTVVCTGPFLKNGYIVAIASQTLRINFNSNSYFQYKKSNGDDIDYVSTIEGYNYPTPADVRYGVEYKSGLAIGTCHVPSADNVRKNIPVDNTVGTADNVTADDILEAIQDSSLPIAARLRNVATVESTGAQLEAYQ